MKTRATTSSPRPAQRSTTGLRLHQLMAFQFLLCVSAFLALAGLTVWHARLIHCGETSIESHTNRQEAGRQRKLGLVRVCLSVCLSVTSHTPLIHCGEASIESHTNRQEAGRQHKLRLVRVCLSVCLSVTSHTRLIHCGETSIESHTNRQEAGRQRKLGLVRVCVSVCHKSHTDYSTLNHTPRQRKRGLINFHTQYWVWVLTRLVLVCLSVCLSPYFLVLVLTRCHLQHYCVFCDQLLTLLSVWNEDQMVCMYVVWPNTAAVRKPNPFWVLMRQEMMGYADEWFSEWSNLMNEWYLCGTSLRTLTWKKGW